MQQLVDLGDIGHVGCRTHDAVYQAGLGIGADMHFHAEVALVTLLRLVHLRITLAFPVLGLARRKDDGGIDSGALAQQQPALTQAVIDYCQNARRQSVLLQQVAEIHDRCVVRDAPVGQQQLGKLTQRGDLVQRFLHRRIAEGEPVSRQVNAQRGVLRIRRTASARLGVERLDQCQQPCLGHHPFHLRQKALAPGLLAFAAENLIWVMKQGLGSVGAISTDRPGLFRSFLRDSC